MLQGAALRKQLRAVPFADRDPWVDRLLGIEDAPADVATLPRGSVPYVPCGADEIVAMVLEAPVRADDVFVDVGSGIGRVAILVHLLSGARTKGVEIQGALVAAAEACCQRLGLCDAVSFAHADVRDANDASLDGTVFFFYAPFGADVLRQVLARLRLLALRKPIRVGTVGFEIHDVPWLTPRASSSVALTLYDSTELTP